MDSAQSDHEAQRPPPTRPRLRRIAAIVNESAGGVGPGASAALAAIVADHGYALDLASPSPGDLEAAIRAAADAGPDLLVILGGDGTACMAAELCGPDGPLLAA